MMRWLLAFLLVLQNPILPGPGRAPASGGGGGGGRGRSSGLKYSPKILKQMAQRGWTMTAGGTPATQYLDSASGRFVVVNDATGNIVQVSGPGFLPNPSVP